jgi:hypothetical protein
LLIVLPSSDAITKIVSFGFYQGVDFIPLAYDDLGLDEDGNFYHKC